MQDLSLEQLADQISTTARRWSHAIKPKSPIQSKFLDDLNTMSPATAANIPAAIQGILSWPNHSSRWEQAIIGIVLSKAIKQLANTGHLDQALDATLLPYEGPRYPYNTDNVRATAANNFARGIDHLIEEKADPAAALTLAQRGVVAAGHNRFLYQVLARKAEKLAQRCPNKSAEIAAICAATIEGLKHPEQLTTDAKKLENLRESRYHLMVLHANLTGAPVPQRPADRTTSVYQAGRSRPRYHRNTR